MALGCLSAPNHPHFDGVENFKGPIYHAGEWPHEGVNFEREKGGCYWNRLIGYSINPNHSQTSKEPDRISANGKLCNSGKQSQFR